MKLPILTYHDISTSAQPDAEARFYAVTPHTFETHLRYLTDANVQTLSLDNVIQINQGGETPSRPAVCLTFDDGLASAYSTVFPLLLKYRLNATFFVVTGRVGTQGCVTWRQLRDMSESGMSIQSHSHTHTILSRCTTAQVKDELSRSKDAIELQLRKPVLGFAIPGREWHPHLLPALQAAGYRAMCTSDIGVNHTPFDLYALRRLSITRGQSHKQFVAFVTADPLTILMYQLRALCLDLVRASIGVERYNRLRSWLLGQLAG
jgi:peptidoglycan/xylan/chitin deacetylase (PgdA/CDA1 family)